MASVNIWLYRQTAWLRNDLTRFRVEALDGSIGKVDEASNKVGLSYVVVRGPWNLGVKVMLPAGVISDIDVESETVFVNRTKGEIKNAPELDPKGDRDGAYRSRLGGYYGRGGSGYRVEER